jgi:hypothetical protein
MESLQRSRGSVSRAPAWRGERPGVASRRSTTRSAGNPEPLRGAGGCDRAESCDDGCGPHAASDQQGAPKGVRRVGSCDTARVRPPVRTGSAVGTGGKPEFCLAILPSPTHVFRPVPSDRPGAFGMLVRTTGRPLRGNDRMGPFNRPVVGDPTIRSASIIRRAPRRLNASGARPCVAAPPRERLWGGFGIVDTRGAVALCECPAQKRD